MRRAEQVKEDVRVVCEIGRGLRDRQSKTGRFKTEEREERGGYEPDMEHSSETGTVER